MDALTNYITSIGFPDEASERWQKYWPANVHVIGKDITRFHSVYWPAFLLSAGLALPQQIFAHGFLTVRGEKMSKSLGNVLDPQVLVSRYGADAVRFFFMREVPFGKDGSFSDEAIVNRVNADLANDIGNLAQRSLSMVVKNLAGELNIVGDLAQEDLALIARADGMFALVQEAIAGLAIHDYLDHVFAVISEANRYFAAQEPWALKNSDPERMAQILYTAAEVVRQGAILLQPVAPNGAATLLDALGISESARTFENLGEAGRLPKRCKIAPPEPAFPRLDMPETAQ
jgi:methionyl-tRNA synthetase